ncbi:MAG: alpha/beta hydrolase [Ilumatobacteraceae bacterium]
MEQVIQLAAVTRLPPGRHLLLPGRGRTFVRHLHRPARRQTVVLLHGWAATADLNWGASYTVLGEHFDVVGVDHRGHGRGARDTGPFTLEACADDVAAVIRELGVGPAIVAGYAMGGPIAQLVWRRHPELVAGLVLCATSDVFCASTRDRAMFAAATGAAAMARARPSKAAVRFLGGQVARHRRLPATPGGGVAAHDWAQVLEAARELGRFDSRGWLPRVDVPVATVTTLHDTVVPTARQRAMASRLRPVAGADIDGGHIACMRAGSGFVDALVTMCRAVGRASASRGLQLVS